MKASTMRLLCYYAGTVYSRFSLSLPDIVRHQEKR